MKYTTKKPLEGVKIWAENELIDTKNVIVCSTPPKEGEKFTGIGFLIFHNNHIYLVENENGKCTPIKRMPDGWKRLGKNLGSDLSTGVYLSGNHKTKKYDAHNAYFKSLRHKMMILNLLQLEKPSNDVPNMWLEPHRMGYKAAEHFCHQNKVRMKEKCIVLDRAYSEKTTYFELLLYKQILNDIHLQKCKEFESVYNREKHFVTQLASMKIEKIKHILHLDKDDNEK